MCQIWQLVYFVISMNAVVSRSSLKCEICCVCFSSCCGLHNVTDHFEIITFRVKHLKWLQHSFRMTLNHPSTWHRLRHLPSILNGLKEWMQNTFAIDNLKCDRRKSFFAPVAGTVATREWSWEVGPSVNIYGLVPWLSGMWLSKSSRPTSRQTVDLKSGPLMFRLLYSDGKGHRGVVGIYVQCTFTGIVYCEW